MLMRFDPFREFDQLVRPWFGDTGRFEIMPVDAYRRGDQFVVDLDLPGADRDSLDVTVEGNVLQVTARRVARYEQDDQVLVGERRHGAVTRQLFLGEGLDTDKIQAHYEDGVLSIVIPVAEEAKPRRIQIGTGSQQAAVGAGSQAA